MFIFEVKLFFNISVKISPFSPPTLFVIANFNLSKLSWFFPTKPIVCCCYNPDMVPAVKERDLLPWKEKWMSGFYKVFILGGALSFNSKNIGDLNPHHWNEDFVLGSLLYHISSQIVTNHILGFYFILNNIACRHS